MGEKYIDKKLVDNSVLRRHGSNKQIMRTRPQEAHNNRMYGVVNRLTANPRLLEQYNEKYIDKKLVDNSVLRRHGSNKQINFPFSVSIFLFPHPGSVDKQC